MSKDTTDLREQILEILWLVNGWNKDDAEEYQEPGLAADQILALISNREKLARIDEWEKFIALESGENGRLATLRKELYRAFRAAIKESKDV